MDKFEEQEIKKNKENKADLKKVKFNKKKKRMLFLNFVLGSNLS